MKFSIFEIGMLVCFGFAWPVNIYNSLKNKTAQGKSLFFLGIIFLGYVCGITHKLLYSRDIVMVLYMLNMVMVGTDIGLFLHYRKKDRLRAAAPPPAP
ncbi:hypothetical protein LJC04_06840 [Ruminococcaceae bacterium OttesenSCG-928-O06]|nr:hypothetical protein [Ruminococcaceae bacterium OttesenSCG-928-O06]